MKTDTLPSPFASPWNLLSLLTMSFLSETPSLFFTFAPIFPVMLAVVDHAVMLLFLLMELSNIRFIISPKSKAIVRISGQEMAKRYPLSYHGWKKPKSLPLTAGARTSQSGEGCPFHTVVFWPRWRGMWKTFLPPFLRWCPWLCWIV